MCQRCHNRKHSAKGAFAGCDVNGMPLDAAHPWFGG
jgi:hypothetical protein